MNQSNINHSDTHQQCKNYLFSFRRVNMCTEELSDRMKNNMQSRIVVAPTETICIISQSFYFPLFFKV